MAPPEVAGIEPKNGKRILPDCRRSGAFYLWLLSEALPDRSLRCGARRLNRQGRPGGPSKARRLDRGPVSAIPAPRSGPSGELAERSHPRLRSPSNSACVRSFGECYIGSPPPKGGRPFARRVSSSPSTRAAKSARVSVTDDPSEGRAEASRRRPLPKGHPAPRSAAQAAVLPLRCLRFRGSEPETGSDRQLGGRRPGKLPGATWGGTTDTASYTRGQVRPPIGFLMGLASASP